MAQMRQEIVRIILFLVDYHNSNPIYIDRSIRLPSDRLWLILTIAFVTFLSVRVEGGIYTLLTVGNHLHIL